MNRLRLLLCCVILLGYSHGLFSAEIREWRSGKHTVKAEFVDYRDGKVKLKRNGKTTVIPLSRLSKADQLYVKNQIEAATKKTPKVDSQKAIRSAANKFLTVLIKQDANAMRADAVAGRIMRYSVV